MLSLCVLCPVVDQYATNIKLGGGGHKLFVDLNFFVANFNSNSNSNSKKFNSNSNSKKFNSNSIPIQLFFSNKQFQFQFQFRNWNWNCPSIPIPELNWPHVWSAHVQQLCMGYFWLVFPGTELRPFGWYVMSIYKCQNCEIKAEIRATKGEKLCKVRHNLMSSRLNVYSCTYVSQYQNSSPDHLADGATVTCQKIRDSVGRVFETSFSAPTT